MTSVISKQRFLRMPYLACAAVLLGGVFFGQTGARRGPGGGMLLSHTQQPKRAPLAPPTEPPLGSTQVGESPAVMEWIGYYGSGVDDGGSPMEYPGTRVASNGVSLRNMRQGAIQLSGCESGEPVVAAFLYWVWLTPTPVAGMHDTVKMKRFFPNKAKTKWSKGIQGKLIGSGGDPCWGAGANWVYRAEVTNLVDKLGVKKIVNGGGTYQVKVPKNASGRTNYRDPWGSGPDDAVPPLMEGVALVVVYAPTSEVPGTTRIYDGTSLEVNGLPTKLSGYMFAGTPGISYAPLTGVTATTQARWIHIGADGQTGGGYGIGPGLGHVNTTEWVAGTPLAGGGQGVSPYSDENRSDWNGSAGVPLPELFDVTGHDVSHLLTAFTGLPISISDNALAASDCMVTVADIVWQD